MFIVELFLVIKQRFHVLWKMIQKQSRGIINYAKYNKDDCLTFDFLLSAVFLKDLHNIIY